MSTKKQKLLSKYPISSSTFIPNPYKIIYMKDDEKTLRKRSEEISVEDIGTEQMQIFFDQLYEAMLAEKLPDNWMHAGVSAVQVGKHIRAFYAYDGNYDYYELFINPKVELLGDSTDEKEESCLSIPDITGKVRRHKRIRVTYYDRDGELRKVKLSGWNARVVQHELDHLDGILFTDKLVED